MVLDSIEINLSELSSNLSNYNPRLEFYHWYDLYYYRNGGNVKISCDDGDTWNIIRPEGDYPENSIVFNNKGIPNEPAYSNIYTGGDPSGNGTDGWELAVFDLSDYKNDTILLRWHCGSITSTFYNRAGWYIDDVKIPYDDDFAEVFERTKPGRPILIKNLVEDKHDYYAVPFNSVLSVQNLKIPTHSPQNNDDTLIVVLVDATNGQFKEASWVHEPVDYLPLSRSDALDIVFDWLIDHGINPDELNIRDIKTNLVYRGSTPYYPDWRVIINELGMEFFVSQEGVLS